MTRLSAIQQRLQETVEGIHRFEKLVAQNPSDDALAVNLQALTKRYAKLERDFRDAAANEQTDVCAYRVFSIAERETLAVVTAAWSHFQKLFSLNYAAIVDGTPKNKGTLSDQVERRTAFGWGFSFSGSVGVMLTLRNDQLLVDTGVDTRIDQAIQLTFDMASTREPQRLAEFARTYGPAPISALFEWAAANAKYGSGADIRWQRRQVTRNQLFMEPHDMGALVELIDRGGDESVSESTVLGKLQMLDLMAERFKLETADGVIQGALDLQALVDIDHPLRLPATYEAVIRTSTRTLYSRGEVEEKHSLLSLKPLV